MNKRLLAALLILAMAIGLLSGCKTETPEEEELANLYQSSTPATYAGGLELLIYNAILHYGENASIGYLINFRAPFCEKGYVSDMAAYNEMGKKICEKWGITYFDMYNHEQITKELKMNTLTHTTDYIHPSSSGYDIISPYIADYMKTMLPCKQEILAKVLEEK